MKKVFTLLAVGAVLLSASLHAEETKPIHRLYSEDLSRDGLQMEYALITDRPLSSVTFESREIDGRRVATQKSILLADSDSLVPFSREKYQTGWEHVPSAKKIYLPEGKSLSFLAEPVRGSTIAFLWFHSLAKTVSYDSEGKATYAQDSQQMVEFTPLGTNDELVRQSSSQLETIVLHGDECEHSPSADSVTYQAEYQGKKVLRIASEFTQFEGHQVPTLIEQIEINERGEMREYTAFRDIKYSRPSEAEIQAALDKFDRDFASKHRPGRSIPFEEVIEVRNQPIQ